MTNTKTVNTVKTATKTDIVDKWITDTRNSEYNFFKATLYALEQFQNKNNKPLYAMIAFTNGKSFGRYKIEQGYTLTQFKTPLKRILDKTLSNVDFRFKEGKASVKVGENGGVNSDRLQALRNLAASKVKQGVKSEAFDMAFPKLTKEKTPLTKEKAQENLHNYMAKMADALDIPFNQVQAMASAKALPKAA